MKTLLFHQILYNRLQMKQQIEFREDLSGFFC